MFKIKYLCFLVGFLFSYYSYGESPRLIPQGWNYECSADYEQYYGYPCVLKNANNRIVSTMFSRDGHAEQGTLPITFRYGETYPEGHCRLWYVRPKPFLFDGPKSYIIDSDWIIVRSLGAVDASYCMQGNDE